jgi:hypothetical protein
VEPVAIVTRLIFFCSALGACIARLIPHRSSRFSRPTLFLPRIFLGASTIRNPRLAALGYLKSSDTNYEVRFSNGACSISFSTERYYHLSVTVTLTDRKGEKFSMGLARQILEPAQRAKELEELKAMRSQYHLDDKSSDKETGAAGTTAYMSLII